MLGAVTHKHAAACAACMKVWWIHNAPVKSSISSNVLRSSLNSHDDSYDIHTQSYTYNINIIYTIYIYTLYMTSVAYHPATWAVVSCENVWKPSTISRQESKQLEKHIVQRWGQRPIVENKHVPSMSISLLHFMSKTCKTCKHRWS